MDSKLTKLVGLKKSEFDAFVKSGGISLRAARLIPLFKPGDEMGLTSVFLASLRLITEFRKMVLSPAKMTGAGQLYVYTEVMLPEFPDSRVDGLLLIVRGGVIRDAAICEMKNGKSELEREQIERYQQVAKFYSIPRVITVSNQFVSTPTQFPITVKQIKSVDLYHFSWSYLLTLSHVLLIDNDTNIADPDQVEIMREVVRYLEFDKSGVCGFNQMKKGWSETVEKINTGARLRCDDLAVRETVVSWQQEERDIALILSRKLGVLVASGQSKHKVDLKGRLDGDIKRLIDTNRLSSTLRIRGAVSDIQMDALFEKRTIEMCVSLKPPLDKKLRGQLGWIERQMTTCMKRDEAAFAAIRGELIIEIWLKNTRAPERVGVDALDDLYTHINGREIKEFRVLCIKDFGKRFSSRIKFVEMIEQMALDFYGGIVQHLTKWEASAPKIVSDDQDLDSSSSDDNTAKQRPEPPPPPEQETANESAAPTNELPAPVDQIETAPCPICTVDLILATLVMGMNECPHCAGSFEAG